ncbi:MAG: hypothetical protein IJ352_00585 [Muribaculaceae bacterium]|nr:hypothetical protein [Muribaculaceae bacterium]
MIPSRQRQKYKNNGLRRKVVICSLFFALLSTFSIFSQSSRLPIKRGEPQRYINGEPNDSLSSQIFLLDDNDSSFLFEEDSLIIDSLSSIITTYPDSIIEEWEKRDIEFNPNPTKAVWLSALFPGLGQVYNRRYWKLPIIVGGFMGLGYATSWNNGMLKDYSQAYGDIMDSDPSTNSYMDFFPNNTEESSLDKTWLTNVLKSRKDFYRRNRDLCIICMVGVYFIAMVDAYVDASLSHFDITPDLSIDVAPAIFQDSHNKYPSVGINWAINF